MAIPIRLRGALSASVPASAVPLVPRAAPAPVAPAPPPVVVQAKRPCCTKQPKR